MANSDPDGGIKFVSIASFSVRRRGPLIFTLSKSTPLLYFWMMSKFQDSDRRLLLLQTNLSPSSLLSLQLLWLISMTIPFGSTFVVRYSHCWHEPTKNGDSPALLLPPRYFPLTWWRSAILLASMAWRMNCPRASEMGTVFSLSVPATAPTNPPCPFRRYTKSPWRGNCNLLGYIASVMSILRLRYY